MLNNKIYIGKHVTDNKNDDYMGSGIELKKDIDNFGKDNFRKEILFECENIEELNKFESMIVNYDFVSRDDTYNKMIGGLGGWEYINERGLNNSANQYKKAIDKHLNLLKSDLEYAEFFCKRIREGLSKIDALEKSQKMKNIWKEKKHPWIGRKHSEKTKEKMREKAKNRGVGCSNNQYGKCWIFNEELKENKSIKKDELESFLILGWKKGRKMNF